MKRILRFPAESLATLAVALLVSYPLDRVSADQVRMRNGDQYIGDLLSINKDTLVLRNDNLGTIRLPRNSVASINFGVALVERAPQQLSSTNRALGLTATNRAVDFSAKLNQSGGVSNLQQQVEAQFLGDAGPEAKAKFNELLSGYLTGRLSVNDIRAQAQSTADQVRSLRKDLGEDAGPMIDGYLAILDSFLKETAPTVSTATNAPAPAPKPKPDAEE